MPAKPADTTITYQIEDAISRFDSLSILPCVAAGFLSRLGRSDTSAGGLAEITESDPALTVQVLRLMYSQHLKLADENFSIRRVLDRLPVNLVRDSFFCAGVAINDNGLLSEQLVLHSLAVGCCAGLIAEIASPRINPQLAYCAGLLHDIGKFALAQAMPKSFARIVEEAQSQDRCSCAIEQKHLGGLDHTILGKRLAQRWHLPDEIIPAIWLHHAGIISPNMPEISIAQIVRLADSVARQCGIGKSGSYDTPDISQALVESLAISPEQLEQISNRLAETVEQRAKILCLDLPEATRNYCRAVHDTAARLACDQTVLSGENRQLQTDSSHLGFVTDLVCSINLSTDAVEIAKDFAVRWQNFYQTGPVCLYLAVPAQPQMQAVVVENLAEPRIVQLGVPADMVVIPTKIAADFAVLNTDEHLDWLFEQLGVDFAPERTKLVPLLSGNRAIGAIVFELRYPCDLQLLSRQFKKTTRVVGTVLDMAFNSGQNRRYAEQFAQLIAEPQQAIVGQPVMSTPQAPAADKSITAMAEMAAGAAHELNNPLSVISGRAQLLAKVENDPEKKLMLEQIQENTSELSQIIDELMSFACPQQPRPARTNVRQMLKDATDLAIQKTNSKQANIQVDVTETDRDAFVDSAQMVSVVANIFANSLESYADQAGPIRVTAADSSPGDFVKLTISDRGCGMDADTLRKATLPFFSAKPAGRKRGMGLAYAARLIELNDGSLDIESQPGSGTTVTILLPSK